MKIISKVALTFKFEGKMFSVKPLEMVEAPEWVKKDPLYGWALADGTLSTTGKDSDLDIESSNTGTEKKLSQMNKEELTQKALEVGISEDAIKSADSNKKLIALIESQNGGTGE